DHIGGVREMAGERNVEVLMHPADLEGLGVGLRDAVANRNRGQLIAYFTRHPGEATPITDGQVLPMLGGLRVVHTPGHTRASVARMAELDVETIVFSHYPPLRDGASAVLRALAERATRL